MSDWEGTAVDRFHVALIVLLTIEIVGGVLFLKPETIKNARVKESAAAINLLGAARAEKAHVFVQGVMGKTFNMNVRGRLGEVIRPTERSRSKREWLRSFNPWGMWDQIDIRKKALWEMLYGILHRGYIMAMTMIVIAPVGLAAAIDGWIERGIAIEKNETTTAILFHGAKSVLLVLILTALALLLLPSVVSMKIWIVWGILVPLCLWLVGRNVQEF